MNMFDYNIVAQGLLRLTNWFSRFGVWDCGMASSMEASFEESYEIRALLHTERVLKLGHAQDVAHSFCNLMLSLQGVHYPDMYDMGYGYDLDANGMVNCSCVADCCSVARAIIDTINAYPDYPKNREYIGSIKAFVDHTLNNYVTDKGVIGVGILGHQINPMKEYWCANSLFSQVLISFAGIAGESKYYEAAEAPMEFLAAFDYRNTDWAEWKTSPAEMILYTGEGVVEGLLSDEMRSRLAVPPRGVIAYTKAIQREDHVPSQAANRVKSDVEAARDSNGAGETALDLLRARWEAFADWLYKNQSPNGLWASPATQGARCYETGLSWLINRGFSIGNTEALLENAVKRQLAYLNSQEAKLYFGLYCNPFATALAHLSFASIAEKLMENDRPGFSKAVDEARADANMTVW